jgi:hypothetical protein
LTRKEQSSREVREVHLGQIRGVDRQDYRVKVENNTEQRVELNIRTADRNGGIYHLALYTLEDGQFLYEFLIDCLRHSSSYDLDQTEDSDVNANCLFSQATPSRNTYRQRVRG